MKRFAWLVGAGSMAAWGLSAAIVACGGDDSAVATDNDAASSTSSSSGGSSTSSSGGSSTSSSGGSSSGSTSSGGTDGGTEGGDGGSSGGITSNPGKITCGTAECAAATQVCCTTIQNTSVDAGCTTSGACTGVRKRCDEKADCQNGDICCGGELQSICDNRCRNGVQLCKTSAECTSDAGGGCKTYTCTGGVKVDACEKPQNCN